MKHELQIRIEGFSVGDLSFNAGENTYQFNYAKAWQQSPNAYYLAPAIPLFGDPDSSGSVHRFLENLLPEGRALDIAARTNQVSKNNVFALIRYLGKEPVGAFSFTSITAQQSDSAQIAREEQSEPIRRHIPDEELSQRIRERDTIPFPVWDGKVRLSVAGYQDKLQVLVEGEHLSFVDGSLSSTHLLKPESRNPHMPYMVANEHYCMTLAARLNQIGRGPLHVASVSLRRVPEPILLIERFDRIAQKDVENPGRVIAVARRHIIDGCQALDLPSTLKYERNLGSGRDVRDIREGVSYTKIFGLLGDQKINKESKIVTPALARTFFTRWAILQLLLGNSDAHGKNISFFVLPAGLMPAPVYDLVSVNAYGDKVEREMAMAYGDAFLPEEVTAYALADFAYRTNIPLRQLAREITSLARSALQLAPELATSALYLGDECDVVHQVATFVCSQANLLLALVRELPTLSQNLFRG
jgi:serine/threonine-protein kinase HipA